MIRRIIKIRSRMIPYQIAVIEISVSIRSALRSELSCASWEEPNITRKKRQQLSKKTIPYQIAVIKTPRNTRSQFGSYLGCASWEEPNTKKKTEKNITRIKTKKKLYKIAVIEFPQKTPYQNWDTHRGKSQKTYNK